MTGKISEDADAGTLGGTELVPVVSGGANKTTTPAKIATYVKSGLAKGDVGLGSVDNTADNAKNVLSATKLTTARNIDGQSFNGTANITLIAPGTHAATSKSTPVDADELPLVDSAASNVLKKLTWANLKAALKAYFDTIYTTGGGALRPTVQIFTSSGTWTKPSGCTAIDVEVVGGGGGSGGTASPSSTQIAVSGPGAAGGTSYKRILATSLGSTETVTIGAGGTAGPSGNNAGGDGGTSSFGSHCQATGGKGGVGGAAGANASQAAGAPGVGSGGDVDIAGGAPSASAGFFQTIQMIVAGSGGPSTHGGGGRGYINGSGYPGGNYGGGAGASSSIASSSARAGAAGAAGIVIVREYYGS